MTRAAATSPRAWVKGLGAKTLLGMNVPELETIAEDVLGEKKFRGKQIYQHLTRGVETVDDMTSLSKLTINSRYEP